MVRARPMARPARAAKAMASPSGLSGLFGSMESPLPAFCQTVLMTLLATIPASTAEPVPRIFQTMLPTSVSLRRHGGARQRAARHEVRSPHCHRRGRVDRVGTDGAVGAMLVGHDRGARQR